MLAARRAKSKSSFVGGNWSKDQQKFLYTNAPQRDFLLTWLGEGAMNVTSTEAMKWAGPLTLLEVIKSCPSGSLATVLAKVQERGSLTLHLVGVSGGLEPMMDWDHFLMGPLSARQQQVVEAFSLPKTPFAGMEVSLTFSEYEDSKHVRRKGPFASGYKEAFIFGKYHEVVKELPDLVLAMNPGFAHYPQSWWTTLRTLNNNGVTVVSTGYGDPLKTVYEYIPSQVELIRDSSKQLQLPEARVKSTRTAEFFTSPGGATTLVEGLVDVTDYVNGEGHIAYSKQVFPDSFASLATGPFVQFCQTANSTFLVDGGTEVSGICSDLNGTFFLSQQAGYSVKLSKKNTFQYCDHAPPHEQCDANGVVVLLEPAASTKPSALAQKDSGTQFVEVPGNLFQETISRALHCTLAKQLDLVPCVEARLLGGPLSEEEKMSGMFESMEYFFLQTVPKCAGGQPHWLPTPNAL